MCSNVRFLCSILLHIKPLFYPRVNKIRKLWKTRFWANTADLKSNSFNLGLELTRNFHFASSLSRPRPVKAQVYAENRPSRPTNPWLRLEFQKTSKPCDKTWKISREAWTYVIVLMRTLCSRNLGHQRMQVPIKPTSEADGKTKKLLFSIITY